MHKTQVFIRDDQYETLKKFIFITGKKQSTMIREAIDLFIQKTEKKQLWKQNLMALSGTLTDQEAKEMQQDIKQTRENWKRNAY